MVCFCYQEGAELLLDFCRQYVGSENFLIFYFLSLVYHFSLTIFATYWLCRYTAHLFLTRQ